MKFILVFLFPIISLAAENTIRLQDYDGFQTKWRLVTVRYRKDNGEQRIVYANDKAWADFEAKKKTFSDGAVFAKIGVSTTDDPAFSNSLEPMGIMRMQLMVKDSKKYKDTDGWGYALFDQEGGRITNKESEMQSCHACHKIVPDRDFVFSRVANFTAKLENGKPNDSKSKPRLMFSNKSVKELPNLLRKQLSQEITIVRFLEGGLRKDVFGGTIDELKPILAAEAAVSGLPALFLSENSNYFVVVQQDSSNQICRGLTPIKSGMTAMFTAIPIMPANNKKIRPEILKANFCF